MNLIIEFKKYQFVFLFFVTIAYRVSAMEESSQEGQQKRSENFKYFAKTGVCKGCDLSGLDLREAIKALRDAGKKINLEEAKLRNCNMQGANFLQADLTGACLDGANLCNANINKANFARCSLKNANFEGSYGIDVIFDEADLSGANFRSVYIHFVKMVNAICIETDFTSASLAHLYAKNANFEKANLSQAFVPGADFSYVKFYGAIFSGLSIDNRSFLCYNNGTCYRFSKKNPNFDYAQGVPESVSSKFISTTKQ